MQQFGLPSPDRLFLVSVGKQSELHGTLSDPGWTTSVIRMQALVSPPDLGLQAKQLTVWSVEDKCFPRVCEAIWCLLISSGVSMFVGTCDFSLSKFVFSPLHFAPMPYFVSEEWISVWDRFIQWAFCSISRQDPWKCGSVCVMSEEWRIRWQL